MWVKNSQRASKISDWVKDSGSIQPVLEVLNFKFCLTQTSVTSESRVHIDLKLVAFYKFSSEKTTRVAIFQE